ncbi:hypothetical protein HPB51_014467 [Rhipicephalus microplus]|uniref:M13 family peptidase n=1 Tax=Rhipicephalus microplus TaxID=6941 RepID=A0A9J6EAC2_RHIMP|nr:hypothetical protein HPB51_014467 [Rhipicephalus microplus]
MSSATHDWKRGPQLSEKTLDGSVGGPPPKPMLWVFVIAMLLLVGIIAVSLVNGESAYRLDSELTALPRQPNLQLDDVATESAQSLPSRLLCGGYAEAVGHPLEEYVATNTAVAIKRHFLTVAGHSMKGVVRPSHDSVTKAVAYYRSCLKTITEHGPMVTANSRALAAFLERNKLTFRSADGVDLLGKTLELLTRYDLQVFFALNAHFLPQPSRNKSYVRFVDSPVFREWEARKADLSHDDFAEYVGNVLSRSGVNERRMADLMDSVRSVEDHVKEARRADEKFVVQETTSAWRRHLDVHMGHVYSGAYRLDVESSSGARRLRAAARVLDEGQRSVYLSWHVARHVVEVCRLVSLHSGDSEDDAKAYCYDQAHGEYKHAVMATYLFKIVNGSRIREVRKMVGSIAKEVRKSIRRSSWLPAMTRFALENKVRMIKWRIGYPAGLGDWQGVDDFYVRHPRPTGVFVADYLGVREARMRVFFAAFRGNNVSATEAFDFANEAAGVAYGAPNQVRVPAVALVRPLFNYGGAPELNYGLLGSILLDAIVRAFDRANMMDDGHGFPVPWPPIQRRLFRAKYKSQASKRNARSRTPTSRKGRTRTSRPAVSVGAHALFRAYKKAAASFDGGRSLRGLEALSADQVFHVGRCFLACGDTHDASADPLFAGHRCNRMARQSLEFASAFRCNRASYTSWRSLCDLW